MSWTSSAGYCSDASDEQLKARPNLERATKEMTNSLRSDISEPAVDLRLLFNFQLNVFSTAYRENNIAIDSASKVWLCVCSNTKTTVNIHTIFNNILFALVYFTAIWQASGENYNM